MPPAWRSPGPDYTWDQFLSDCEMIKEAGFTPVAVSLQEVPHYWFEFTVYNNGSPANHLDVPAAATDAAGEKWAAGFDDLKALYEAGYLPENTPDRHRRRDGCSSSPTAKRHF